MKIIKNLFNRRKAAFVENQKESQRREVFYHGLFAINNRTSFSENRTKHNLTRSR